METKLTDDQREELDRKLSDLGDAISGIDKAAEPFDAARHALQGIYDGLVEDAGIEIIGHCEGCERLLIEGDKGHRCDDGPILCEKCSPTYGDSRKQALERQGEGNEEAGEQVADIDAYVASGGSLEDTAAWEL